MQGSLECLGGAGTREQALALMRWHRTTKPRSSLWGVPYFYVMIKPDVDLPEPLNIGGLVVRRI